MNKLNIYKQLPILFIELIKYIFHNKFKIKLKYYDTNFYNIISSAVDGNQS